MKSIIGWVTVLVFIVHAMNSRSLAAEKPEKPLRAIGSHRDLAGVVAVELASDGPLIVLDSAKDLILKRRGVKPKQVVVMESKAMSELISGAAPGSLAGVWIKGNIATWSSSYETCKKIPVTENIYRHDRFDRRETVVDDPKGELHRISFGTIGHTDYFWTNICVTPDKSYDLVEWYLDDPK